MAWVTPKTDWAAGNAVASADLNRIEGNILWLNQRVLSGCVGGDTDLTRATDSEKTLQRCGITIPAGKDLILVRALYHFGSLYMRLRVYAGTNLNGLNYTNRWTSLNEYRGDESPEFLLEYNDTGSNAEYTIVAGAHNTHTGNATLSTMDGWSLAFAIKDHVA